MNSPLIHLILVQLREFFRERGNLFWSFFFPVAMAGVLGLAFASPRPLEAKIALVGPSEATASLAAELNAALLKHGQEGHFHFQALSFEKALRGLKRGRVGLILELESPPSGSPTLTFRYDPGNREAATTRLRIEQALRPTQARLLQIGTQPFAVRSEPLRAPGSRYIDFLLPGMIAMSVMNSSLWGIGQGLIELRMKKLLRCLAASPIRPWHLFAAAYFARLVFILMEGGLLFLFGYIGFRVGINGSILALLILFLSGSVAFSGLAVLLAARAQNSRIGAGLINSITLPLMVVSGIFFSYENFPEWLAPILGKLPLALLADGLRDVFTGGALLPEVLWPSFLLVAMGGGFFALAVKRFQWH